MGKYRLVALARADLADIGEYTQFRWGIAQRNRYLDDLERTFQRLVDQGHLGKIRDEIGLRVLSHLHAQHVIFFRRENGDVEIFRILHQRQSVEKAFDERPFEK